MDTINNFFNSVSNITINMWLDISISILIILVFKIFNNSFAYIIIKMFKFKEKDQQKIKQSPFYKPLKHLFLLLGIYIACFILQIPENVFSIVNMIFKIIIILLISRGFSGIFDISSDSYQKLRKKLHFNGNDALISLMCKAIKFLIYLIAGFIILSDFGYDLGGLFAGLGIGSVVVALAAQDLAKSIISGVSIIVDKPFNIGDYIIVDSLEGTVEDITFRSTRIRDTNNQVLIIPNNTITSSTVINCTKRLKRKFALDLIIELNTPLESLSAVSEKIKLLLNSHPNIIKEDLRVLLDTITDNGYKLNITFYTDLIDFMDFLKFKEEINYSIIEILNHNSIQLAYNTQTIYIQKWEN